MVSWGDELLRNGPEVLLEKRNASLSRKARPGLARAGPGLDRLGSGDTAG